MRRASIAGIVAAILLLPAPALANEVEECFIGCEPPAQEPQPEPEPEPEPCREGSGFGDPCLVD